MFMPFISNSSSEWLQLQCMYKDVDKITVDVHFWLTPRGQLKQIHSLHHYLTLTLFQVHNTTAQHLQFSGYLQGQGSSWKSSQAQCWLHQGSYGEPWGSSQTQSASIPRADILLNSSCFLLNMIQTKPATSIFCTDGQSDQRMSKKNIIIILLQVEPLYKRQIETLKSVFCTVVITTKAEWYTKGVALNMEFYCNKLSEPKHELKIYAILLL